LFRVVKLALIGLLDRVSDFIQRTDRAVQNSHDPCVNDQRKPIPFFGHIDTARILTVGLSSSADEFKGAFFLECLGERQSLILQPHPAQLTLDFCSAKKIPLGA